jgi:cobalt-zinc-cadmium efflux system outer membrane protein
MFAAHADPASGGPPLSCRAHGGVVRALAFLMAAMLVSPCLAQSPAPAGEPAPRPAIKSDVPVAPRPEGNAGVQGMTLTELEDMAQQCNPTLVQAAARAQAAEGEACQAGLCPNPVAGYRATEIGDEGHAGQQGGFVGQEIVTGGKRQLSRQVALQEVQQARWEFEAQRRRVLTDVRRGYFDVLVAQSTVDLAQQLVHIGQEGVATAEKLMQAKEVARFDVLQARIEADSARVVAERARNRYQAAWRSLAAVAGIPDLQPTRLAGDVRDGLTPLTWEESLARLLTDSPVLAGARAGVCRAQAALARQCAERTPNLNVETAVQYDNATNYTFADVQVGMPIPVFNRNQGNILKAQSELAAAQQNVRRVELELQQRLAVVFEQYTNARYQVEKYTQDIIPNAKASLDLVTSGYQQGEFNYLTLLTAQRTYFQANAAYLEALRELRFATATIEGSLLSDSLQEGK